MSELKDKAAMDAVVAKDEKKEDEKKADDSATATLFEVGEVDLF